MRKSVNTNYLVNKKIDYIVCIESFGYVFGIPVAYNLGCKIILARKPGKLPRDTISSHYEMVYDSDRSIEIHSDVIKTGDNVIVIDDFLASGGTVCAVMDILSNFGAKILESLFIVELPELNGRDALHSRCENIYSLIDMEYESNKKYWNVYGTRII
ncbi:MAG: adenine phosphoribosyltransferase [Candidatus Electrothrix sp. GM3_4]|nr:adenine phosphoribosyltransferase [Candidatus Electrothrix sp. GM3_4]